MATETAELMDARKEVDCLNEELAANPVTAMKRVAELMVGKSAVKKPHLYEKCEFNYNGELLVPVLVTGNDFECLMYLRDVKGSVHDKIVNNVFVFMGDMVHDTKLSESLQHAEMTEHRSLTQNIPLSPPSIESKLELFQRLFLFGSFYLQKFPRKMASFFDYLLYLIEQADMLTVAGLVHLDHLIQQDFAANPQWNWAQHRAESVKSQNRIILKDEYKISTYKNSAKMVKGTTYIPKSLGKQVMKSKKSATVTHDSVRNEICRNWNKGKCKFSDCWRHHICNVDNCGGDHKAVNCSKHLSTSAGN